MMRLSPLNRRRWQNFTRNRRAYWSLWVFAVLFGITLFSEFIANDKPILLSYRGEIRMPIFSFYSERDYGGDFATEAAYKDPEVQCLIRSGGLEDCFDDPEGLMARIEAGEAIEAEGFQRGWIVWPMIPFRYDTIVDIPGVAPAAPSATNWLGTDDTKRDVVARVLYGFRLSVYFALITVGISTVLGIAAGAVQGYFGGMLDLMFQRFIEIFSSTPTLYVIIILTSIFGKSFWLLVIVSVIFGWMGLAGLVRAEFLRARNFEYVRAARALGVSDRTIMFRHVLPNAMVATLTLMPFAVTGAIGGLASLDFLGFGLPSNAPSLGELTLQAKQNLQAPWLGFTAFAVFSILLTLLVFIFEGVRDAFDPRKVFK